MVVAKPDYLIKDAAPVSTGSVLDVHDVTVAYHRKPVLWNVDVSIDQPRMIGIVGPNGAGKSTLIKAMLGLLPMVSGGVRFFGQPLEKVRQRVGYVPQRESVDWDFPINVEELVLMGTYGRVGWFRRPGKMEREAAVQALTEVGMADYRHRQIGQLSGGQQQRVFLARALAQKADLYCMDEPMAGVDAATEEAIFRLLQKLKDDGKTVIVVHHDLRSVARYFEDVWLLNTRLVAAGPVETTFTQANLQKTYGGKLTALEAVSAAVGTQTITR